MRSALYAMIFKAHDFDGEGNVSDTQAMFGCLESIETRRLLTGAQLEFSKIPGLVIIALFLKKYMI